jgi:hypothetical protein
MGFLQGKNEGDSHFQRDCHLFIEVHDGRVAVRGDFKKAAEGGHVAGRAFSDDLLLEIGARIGFEIGLRVVRKVDGRQEPPGRRPAEIESASELSPGQRVQVFDAGPAAQQIDARAAQFPGARAHQQEADPPAFDQPVHFVESGVATVVIYHDIWRHWWQ